jgi:D-alanyl-D-alanine carboxypeptidase/D-alanyl-D-alanine-endopeptidase (penicillin-binding protein 4)
VRITKDTARGDYVVTGALAVGDSSTLTFTHRDPAEIYVGALREALGLRGITVVGEGSQTDARRDTLVVVYSPPLSEILGAFMKPSQNQMAEVLFKAIGLERGRAGSAAEARRVVEAQLQRWGAPDDGYVVRDGSGLSRYDFLSPETVIRVLDAMRRSPHFQVFHDALPIAGVDGTLRSRMRGTPAERNLRAKTGSLAQSRALSGYVRTADGQLLMFSALANNWTVPAAEVERAHDAIGASLAALRLK